MHSEISNILLAGGAILAVIGALRIYYKWSHGADNIEREIMVWAGGILFLVLIQFFIKAVFY
ncbi:DUF4134 family protein [Niabella sp. CJ426]|uniref:DUF4134 family protein n=1 Tax=Niabella sp. CJ426 TaxID=3393740 RepID=UPI003D067384